MCDKKRTRAEAFAADVLHGERERRDASKAICRAILSRIDPAGTILCFMPLRDEVDILPVFDAVFENGGRVVLPYCIDRERMTLRLYQKDGELVRDAMKILSPKQDISIDPAEIDAALTTIATAFLTTFPALPDFFCFFSSTGISLTASAWISYAFRV